MGSTFDDYQTILASGLFDAAHYKELNRRVDWRGLDPLMHYLEEGVLNGASPNPNFDVSFYLDQCRKAGPIPKSPLVHFLEEGAAMGLKTHPRKPIDPKRFVRGAREGGVAQVSSATGGIQSDDRFTYFLESPLVIDSRSPIRTERTLDIRGWVFAIAGVEAVTVRVAGFDVAKTPARIARHDVLAAFPEKPEALRSGFELSIPRRKLRPGVQAVELHITDKDGAVVRTGFQIDVQGEADDPATDYADQLARDMHRRMARIVSGLKDDLGRLAVARRGEASAVTEQISKRLELLGQLIETTAPDQRQYMSRYLTIMEDAARVLGSVPLELKGLGKLKGKAALCILEPSFAEDFPPFELPVERAPVVSVIVPVFNQFAYTYRCLRSFLECPPKVPYEIIVVDDCSTDETILLTSIVSGIRVLKNRRNSGFIETCNRGAKAARGNYLMLLNNDTAIHKAAVDELLATFGRADAGMVGSKLVFPDGRLQEAGAIVWRDGSGWNYGRGDDPESPAYNYVRAVDYCSAASVMIPKRLWRRLKGFDPRYKPAYYEDADLAFRVRHLGLRVYYQPRSVVVHFEGASSGRDVDTGVKSSMLKNRKIFHARWGRRLATHAPLGQRPLLARDAGVARRAFFLDATTPTPDQDAGSNHAVQHMRILQSLGFKVTFAPTDNFANIAPYTDSLQQQGIECVYRPWVDDLGEFLRQRGGEFDLAYVHRFAVAEEAIPLLRKYAPQAPILFNNADLHHLRMARHKSIDAGSWSERAIADLKSRELAVVRAANGTVVCSTAELEILEREVPGARVRLVPWVIDDSQPPTTRREGRKGIMFLGGFGHPPNADAVKYFVAEIMPLIRRRARDTVFHVYGSKIPDDVRALASDDVVIEGFVEDLATAFSRHLVSVLPLRFGAGFKGKLAESLRFGVPTVATPMAAEGAPLKDGRDLLVEDDPKAFAGAILRLLSDRSLWRSVSRAGQTFAQKSFGFEQGRRRLADLIAELGLKATATGGRQKKSSTRLRGQKSRARAR